MIKEKLEETLKRVAGGKVVLETPKGEFGDFCLTPGVVSGLAVSGEEIKKTLLETDLVEDVKLESGYINIYLSDSAYLREFEQIRTEIEKYLDIPENKEKTIVFDYSSPNIAKPFSVGHLRSTVIGQANYNAHKALGYKTVGINHIGDWGTQFGKLIYAVKTWGNEGEIEKDPIAKLNELYIKFHDEAEKNPQIEDMAREWSKKLEDGDAETRSIWQKCVEWSFREFDRLYDILNVKIDEVAGESFYEDKLELIVDELKEKNLLRESEGARIVELENLPPALIKRSDGATLYMTRDLAALKYRIETYKPTKIIYHVGNDQSLHFRQLEALAYKLGWLESVEIVFAGHGMMRLAQRKMSTRAGRTVLLEDLIVEAKKRALVIIEEKSPDLPDKEKVAQEIGVSAIKYADLSTNRKSDVIFSFDRMLSLEGNSGPYLQYSYARAHSLIQKFHDTFAEAQAESYLPNEAKILARKLVSFKSFLEKAAANSSPNLLCEVAYNIAREFNSFYEKKKIITEQQEESRENIYIIELTKIVLGKIFDLLGIAKPEKI